MKKLRYQLLALSILLLGSYSAYAQTGSEPSRGGDQSETIQVAQMAKNLVNYGQQNEDPYTLVAAAKMLMQYNVEAAGNAQVEAGEGTTDAPEEATGGSGVNPLELNAAAILDQAKAYADEDSSIMQVIAELRNQKARGYAYGNGYIKVWEDVPAYGSRDFNWTFTGNEFAEILFVGDGDTDIDVYVYDSNTGRLLASDESYQDGAYFSWTPPYTKQYTFRVVNRGKYTNTTYVVSN